MLGIRNGRQPQLDNTLGAGHSATGRRNLTIPLRALRGPAATLGAMHPALKALGGLDELVAHLDERPADVTYAMVTVQTHRNVSNAVTSRLGVRHATPQALLVREGRVVWSASHFRVTAAAMAEAILSS